MTGHVVSAATAPRGVRAAGAADDTFTPRFVAPWTSREAHPACGARKERALFAVDAEAAQRLDRHLHDGLIDESMQHAHR